MIFLVGAGARLVSLVTDGSSDGTNRRLQHRVLGIFRFDGHGHDSSRGGELIHAAPRACQRRAGCDFPLRTRNGVMRA